MQSQIRKYSAVLKKKTTAAPNVVLQTTTISRYLNQMVGGDFHDNW